MATDKMATAKKEPKVSKPTASASKQKSNTSRNIIIGCSIVLVLFILLMIGLGVGGYFFGKKIFKDYSDEIKTAIDNQEKMLKGEGYPGVGQMPGMSSGSGMGPQSGMGQNQGSGTGISDLTAIPYTASSDYADYAVNYWNCRYGYSLSYPLEWSNNGMTFNSDLVLLYGNQLTTRIEAKNLSANKTLQSFAEEESLKIGRAVESTQKINWNGTVVFEYNYFQPSSKALFWLAGDYGMKLVIEGANYTNATVSFENMLGTLQVNVLPAECDSSTSGNYVPQATTQTGFDCANWVHPNGDIDYWWWDISQQERDCYVSRYGQPNLNVNVYNENYDEYYDEYPDAAGDVPYCDYENDPACWPGGVLPQ